MNKKFTFLLVDVHSDVMQTHFCSCVGLVVRVWLLVHLSTLSFSFSFVHVLTTLHILLSIPHPIIAHLSQCQCGHTINDLGIDLLHCPCGNESIVAHDMLWNTITTIALKSGAHVQKEVSHLFPTTHRDKWILSSLETIFEF